MLGDHGEATGAFSTGYAAGVLPTDPDRPGMAHGACQGPHEGCLSCSVGTDHHQPGPTGDGQVEAVQDRPATEYHRDIGPCNLH